MRKYSEYLADKEREKQEGMVAYPYTDNEEINHLRQLVEDMSKWMSIGSFQQRTPQKVVNEFKDTMKRTNAIIRQNKQDREE